MRHVDNSWKWIVSALTFTDITTTGAQVFLPYHSIFDDGIVRLHYLTGTNATFISIGF
jgi:hypothetical protein